MQALPQRGRASPARCFDGTAERWPFRPRALASRDINSLPGNAQHLSYGPRNLPRQPRHNLPAFLRDRPDCLLGKEIDCLAVNTRGRIRARSDTRCELKEMASCGLISYSARWLPGRSRALI